MIGLRRHTLVWLSQAPGAEDAQDRALVDRWQADGRPFVVCRRRGEPGELSLGFCAVHDKFPEIRPRRIAAHTLAKHVVRIARPPGLKEVAKCRPAAAHAAAFARLGTEAARAGLDLRIYGSWMWQALTGEPHVRPSSDLDILVEVRGRRDADGAAGFADAVPGQLARQDKRSHGRRPASQPASSLGHRHRFLGVFVVWREAGEMDHGVCLF